MPLAVSMAPPYVSILISAHYRREFLPAAVDSALSQTADRSSFEVVVVKGFTDPALDIRLRAQGVQVYDVLQGHVGARVQAMLPRLSGDVVALLEDDDLFLPTKVTEVASRFRTDPDLDYYHNGVEPVDRLGVPIPSDDPVLYRLNGLFRPLRAPFQVDPKTMGPSRFNDLMELGAGFNLSSISVRRRVLAHRPDLLPSVQMSLPLFLLFQVYASGGRILLDPARTTRYRIYPGNNSPDVTGNPIRRWERMIRGSDARLADLRLIRSLVQDQAPGLAEPFLETSLLTYHIFSAMGSKGMHRAHMARSLVRLLRLNGLRILVNSPAPFAIGGLRLFSDHLSRAASRSIRTLGAMD